MLICINVLTIIQGHHIRQGAVIRHAQVCTQKGNILKVSIKPTVCVHECSAQFGLKRAAVSLTFVLAGWDGDARWVALALDPVLEHGLLQILHFLLLPLALLLPALLLWFAEVPLQREFAGRLVNLPLKSQVSFQPLQLWILQWSQILTFSFSWWILVSLLTKHWWWPVPVYPDGSDLRPAWRKLQSSFWPGVASHRASEDSLRAVHQSAPVNSKYKCWWQKKRRKCDPYIQKAIVTTFLELVHSSL